MQRKLVYFFIVGPLVLCHPVFCAPKVAWQLKNYKQKFRISGK